MHEGIVSEEIWNAAHEKRIATGVKGISKIGKERSHLLTGIIKCPKCGAGMYANKVCWTKKDGTYKEVYYYACGRKKRKRGHHCDYSSNLKKSDIEPLIVEIIKELVQDESFASEIKRRIGIKIDTTKLEQEIANYEISHLIQEIQIYPEGESECPLKSIKFNFPVYKDGKEVREVFLKSEHNVETLVVLRRN